MTLTSVVPPTPPPADERLPGEVEWALHALRRYGARRDRARLQRLRALPRLRREILALLSPAA
jgi:hypothetical protein